MRINADGTDIRYKKHSRPKTCRALGCTNAPGKKKAGLCPRCYHRRNRIKNTLRYAYDFHKQNAKRRGHRWELTYEDFRHFWLNLHPEHWKKKRANILKDTHTRKVKNRICLYEMDRINHEGPYRLDNLQCVPKAVNVRREWDWLKRRNEWTVTSGQPGKERVVFTTVEEVPEDFVPSSIKLSPLFTRDELDVDEIPF